MHRVKAVRFSFTPGDEEGEEDKPEEIQNSTAGILGNPETLQEGDVNSGRLGSQQCLTGKQREQGPKEKRKSDYLCGLCSNKRAAASVWNCDGEILKFTEISCR